MLCPAQFFWAQWELEVGVTVPAAKMLLKEAERLRGTGLDKEAEWCSREAERLQAAADKQAARIAIEAAHREAERRMMDRLFVPQGNSTTNSAPYPGQLVMPLGNGGSKSAPFTRDEFSEMLARMDRLEAAVERLIGALTPKAQPKPGAAMPARTLRMIQSGWSPDEGFGD